MEVDYFKDIIVPVIGGLGIFMLALEFMEQGIQRLAVNRMRELLAKMAGTPVKGVMAGTFITGIIQSSTAMTVMVVGLVNSGILGLRPAISVIMGANIGTTLGNGLIALPLGPIGLLCAGVASLVHVFSKDEKIRNISLALIGFSLIFYGLNLMTGGLRPLRNMPEVMSAISSLDAGSTLGVVYCVMIAAVVTAIIHSSSATIGIVMGLGSAGVLGWQTAVAFSLGADLGTTITSWMASLSLSKNAKRAAYAHMAFNVIGVLVMLPLFFPSISILTWAMGFFGGDPGVPVTHDGKETFPLVPVAVGLYSTGFNLFNTALLLPFVGVFERVLARIGRTSAEDVEDYSTARFLDSSRGKDLVSGLPLVQQEMARYVQGASLFAGIARGDKAAPHNAKDHQAAIDILSQDIRRYTAAMFRPDMPHAEADLLASLIEEEDWTASLGETLYQVARRVERRKFSITGQAIVESTLEQITVAMRTIVPDGRSAATTAEERARYLVTTREQNLKMPGLAWEERGAILELLGSAERAFFLIERIDAERRSVPRVVAAAAAKEATKLGAPALAPAST